MANPLVFLRFTAPALALAGLTLAAQPAAAQFFGAWGGSWGGPWGGGYYAGPPRVYGPPPAEFDDTPIPPRVVRDILRSRGYRLVSTPRLAGERIIALGENAGGQQMRFVIDAYGGELIRTSLAGPTAQPDSYMRAPRGDARPENFASAPDDVGGGGLAEPRIDTHSNAFPTQKPKKRTTTAARTNGEPKSPTLTPAPTQATKMPRAPLPAPAPAPEQAGVAPAAPQTPLAPDARPADKGPADIGPRVQPVPTEARAPQVAPVAAPVPEPAPAPKAIEPVEPAAVAPAAPAAPATPDPEPGK